MNKILIGVSEAGELASVSAQLVREWCNSNVIPFSRNGNRVLIRNDTLDLFLKVNEGKDLSQISTLINPGFKYKDLAAENSATEKYWIEGKNVFKKDRE